MSWISVPDYNEIKTKILKIYPKIPQLKTMPPKFKNEFFNDVASLKKDMGEFCGKYAITNDNGKDFYIWMSTLDSLLKNKTEIIDGKLDDDEIKRRIEKYRKSVLN